MGDPQDERRIEERRTRWGTSWLSFPFIFLLACQRQQYGQYEQYPERWDGVNQGTTSLGDGETKMAMREPLLYERMECCREDGTWVSWTKWAESEVEIREDGNRWAVTVLLATGANVEAVWARLKQRPVCSLGAVACVEQERAEEGESYSLVLCVDTTGMGNEQAAMAAEEMKSALGKTPTGFVEQVHEWGSWCEHRRWMGLPQGAERTELHWVLPTRTWARIFGEEA